MPKITFMRGLAALFVFIVAVVFLWQHPGTLGSRLTPGEIDRYMAATERNMPESLAERADMLRRIRAWALADDGGPVYMLNLMRFYPKVRPLPGGPPPDMAPEQANAHYENYVTPMLLAKGATAPFMGHSQGQDVLPFASGGDHWNRMLLIRYPSRRTFLKLISDPAYGPIAPYKLASLEIILAPFSSEMMMPDTTLSVGALLLFVFLGVGWWRERKLRAG